MAINRYNERKVPSSHSWLAETWLKHETWMNISSDSDPPSNNADLQDDIPLLVWEPCC